MRAEGLAVLGSQGSRPAGREVVSQHRQVRSVEGVCHSSSEEAQAGGVEADGGAGAENFREIGGDGAGVVSWQVVEQRQVRRDEIPVRGKCACRKA